MYGESHTLLLSLPELGSIGRRGRHYTKLRVLLAASIAAVCALLFCAWPNPAWAGDSADFYWGTDDNGPAPGTGFNRCNSTSEPWLEPNVSNNGCGNYQYYGGNVGSFETLACGEAAAGWNQTAANRAHQNFEAGLGLGTVAYWYGGGPGSDPNYDGTASEATSWGQEQAEHAITDAENKTLDTYLVILDVEDNGYEGWNEVDYSGTCNAKSSGIAVALDKDTLNGFLNYIYDNSPYFEGVYSSTSQWNSIFGSYSLTDTTEITADWGEGCYQPAPLGWNQPASPNCTAGNSANFFGGVSSSDSCAFAWQWYGSSSADYDQVAWKRVIKCK